MEDYDPLTRVVEQTRTAMTFYTQGSEPTPDQRELVFKLIDQWMERRIMEKLSSCYPGYSWWVSARHFHGICHIKLPELSDWGETLKLVDLKGDPGLKEVMLAGGRLLERFRLRRGRSDTAELNDAHNRMIPWLTRGYRPAD